MVVAAPADKRFRRAHVRPGRRRSWMPSRRLLVHGAILLAVMSFPSYRALAYLQDSGALLIRHIEMTGETHLARGEVFAMLDGLHGTHILTADLEGWRERLLELPWVADATMRRSFPRTVEVVVRERRPLGIARLGESLYLIDEAGVVIDEFGPQHAAFDLPLISGLATRPGGRAQVDERRAALAARLLADVQQRPELARRISQVDVSDGRDASVLLEGDTVLVRVGHADFVSRLESYLELAPALRERIPEIDYVDVRVEDRVYVRPQSSPGSASRPRPAASRDPVRARGTTGRLE